MVTTRLRRWPQGHRRQEELEHDEWERVLWVFPNRHGCPEEQQALIHQAALEEQEEARLIERSARVARENAGLIGRLAEYTFENYFPRSDWAGARLVGRQVVDYCEALLREKQRQPWLVLWGNYGTGKTHLAAAVLHTMIEAGWKGVYYKSWPGYLSEIESTFGGVEGGALRRFRLVEQMALGKLIVIDDIDKRRPTRWSLDMAFEPLNQRCNEALPTVLIFNSDPTSNTARDFVGSAIADRILEMAFDLIHFDGPSLRPYGDSRLIHAT